MKTILFVIMTLNRGGAEHVLVDIVNRMVESGFSVTVQTLLDEGCYRDKLSASVKYKGGLRTSSALIKRFFLKFCAVVPCQLLGLLFIHGSYSYLVGFTEGLPTKIIAGCRKKAKRIAWVHTDLFANYESKGAYGTEEKNREIYLKFDQVVCVSNGAKDGFLQRIGEHPAIKVRYNPINKSEILKKSNEPPAYTIREDDSFRIVAVGRLKNVKGFDLIIEAMAVVKARANRSPVLYIIGGGDEEQKLQNLIVSYGLEDTVFLCGEQANPYSIMRQCDMQVISSRAEGYSLALCEGHLLGLPVVSTKCSGPAEIIPVSNAGLLVGFSVKELADGIIKMINNEQVYKTYKRNAAEWSKNYCADAVYRQIETLFR